MWIFVEIKTVLHTHTSYIHTAVSLHKLIPGVTGYSDNYAYYTPVVAKTLYFSNGHYEGPIDFFDQSF